MRTARAESSFCRCTKRVRRPSHRQRRRAMSDATPSAVTAVVVTEGKEVKEVNSEEPAGEFCGLPTRPVGCALPAWSRGWTCAPEGDRFHYFRCGLIWDQHPVIVCRALPRPSADRTVFGDGPGAKVRSSALMSEAIRGAWLTLVGCGSVPQPPRVRRATRPGFRRRCGTIPSTSCGEIIAGRDTHPAILPGTPPGARCARAPASCR